MASRMSYRKLEKRCPEFFCIVVFSNQCGMHITFLNAKARQELGKKRKAGTKLITHFM
jgi:hypothetical protein